MKITGNPIEIIDARSSISVKKKVSIGYTIMFYGVFCEFLHNSIYE
jgi:hypothetical protein